MPRNGPAPRRELMPDRLPVGARNPGDQQGPLARQRTVAERIVYTALDTVKERTDSDPVAVLKRAVENVRPELEVKSRRVGGATYQVPVEVRPRRATTLAIRWLTTFSKQRRRRPWPSASPPRSSMPATASGQQSSARGHAQDGRIQQGLRPLPLVVAGPKKEHYG